MLVIIADGWDGGIYDVEGVNVRKKKYRTAAALLKAVNAYFDSVSHTEYVTCGDDKNPRRVRSDSGTYIHKREFLVPPSISALCLHIGISRQTWSEYSDPKKNPEFAEVCEMAKLIIEVYLEEQLLSRRKGVQGIMFNLKNNFGWVDSRERPACRSDNDDEDPGEELLEGMSFDEKIALISETSDLIKEDASDAEC